MSALSQLLPPLRAPAEVVVGYLGPFGGRVTSVYRSYTDQLRLWRNRASNPYPVAPPGSSMHQRRRAFDVSGADVIYLREAGRWWRSIGGTWSESDPIHFEA